MSTKSKGTRTFIIFMVVLFAFSSLATSGLVIYQLAQGNGNDSEDIQQQLQDQLNQQNKEGKLQGTKLKDFKPGGAVKELKIIDTKVGDGAVVKEGADVVAHYTGAIVKDGTIFQSSHDSGEPVPFNLNGVIPGWTKGVPGMKVGGIRRLIIPAELAYGDQSPSPDIPPNSDLVFDIELVSVK